MLRTIAQFYSDSNTGKMTPGFNMGIVYVEGVQALLQKIARLILTVPGSNFYYPDLGNVFAASIGGVQSADETELKIKLQLGLTEIETKIKIEQSLEINLVPEEKLNKLSIARFWRDPADYTVVEVDVLVITEANETYILRV
jgi:hypothetical protein